MREDNLLAALRGSDDNEVWVRALAAWFDAHALHFGHGTDNALDEAYWLIRHLQDWDAAAWQAPARPELADRAMQIAVQRVHSRKPLAYLLGEAWFCGLRFHVDEHVLVPRSPLAEIIERGFEPWMTLADGDRLLDIGTGSGCIAIAAAVRIPQLVVAATDVSDAALAVAARNVALHGVGERVQLQRADLFPRGHDKYRVIIANPPYVPATQYAQLPPEYLHEPRQGLVGGPDGLEPAWQILAGSASRLTDDGVVILEVGNEAPRLDAALGELAPIWVEFERGGTGVCVVQARSLREFARTARFPPSVE
ncbi:MAG TPA: 50S ribosomal protein L3 N(5)-glutamine methyltransferase [Gammaproteobacteria bacterium]|nr:50S ribosomal protein L3 N(5)-glutamine methyltransferase [Gammaproteobacteria bacterium]